MIKFYGEYTKIQELENKLDAVCGEIDLCYDFFDENSVPQHLFEMRTALERELATLKRNRKRGGLVCTCM